MTLNHWHQRRVARLVITRLTGTASGKLYGLLGFFCKAETYDTRESLTIRIYRNLLEEGAILQIVDPKVGERQMAHDLGRSDGAGKASWQRGPDVVQAADGADALLLLTEWQQFAAVDRPAVVAVMRRQAWLFDIKAKADGAAASAAGLILWAVGEGTGL